MRANTNRGLRAHSASGPIPRRSHNAGPERIDHHIGRVGEAQQSVDVGRALQVECDTALAAHHRVRRNARTIRPRRYLGSIDGHHVSPEVGQDHGAVRAGALSHQLDDANTRERSGHGQRPASSTARSFAQR